MIRKRFARVCSCTAVIGLLLTACGGDDGAPASARPSRDTMDLQGASLLVGSSVKRWTLLAVPERGGVVTARPVRDPERVVWRGETELPRFTDLHVLKGPLLVLRTSSGAVHRYDPRSDELERVGATGRRAGWESWGAYGVFRDAEGSTLVEVGPEGSWSYRLASRPAWAGVVEGGRVAVLLEAREGRSPLWLVRRGDSEPEAETRGSYGGPALVTAWGRRLVLTDGGTGLEILSVPELTRTLRVDVGGVVRALAASPSSHVVYAGVESPPRVVAVNRFTEDTTTVAELPRPARQIRPAVLGQFLLLYDGAAVRWVPLGGEEPRRLDTEWRDDLPLGTPAGEVLTVRDSAVRMWDPDTGEYRAVGTTRGLRWVPVSWNPSPPAVVAGRMAGKGAGADEGTGASASAGDSAAGPDTSRRPRGAPAAGPDAPADEAAGDTARAGPVEPGFYAIVASAREADGVRQLLDRLFEAGYPTALQEHRDDAGRVWYRGLVGPYQSRAEAEAAGRQLRREQDLSVWVTQVRPGATPGDVLP